MLAIAYHNLAVQEEMLGHFKEGLTCYRKAVRVVKTHCGEEHPLVTSLMSSEAEALRKVQEQEQKQRKILKSSGKHIHVTKKNGGAILGARKRGNKSKTKSGPNQVRPLSSGDLQRLQKSVQDMTPRVDQDLKESSSEVLSLDHDELGEEVQVDTAEKVAE